MSRGWPGSPQGRFRELRRDQFAPSWKHRRLCALQKHRPFRATPFSAEGPIPLRSFVADVSGGIHEKGSTAMKSIISPCPIHLGCTLEVVFGNDAHERIPFPDPALKPIAERDFPDQVPIRAIHVRAAARRTVSL